MGITQRETKRQTKTQKKIRKRKQIVLKETPTQREIKNKMSRTCSTKIPGKQDAHKKTATTCNACHWFICWNPKCKYVHTEQQEEVRKAYFVALNTFKKYSKRKKQKTLSIKEIDAVRKGIKPLSLLGNICPWFTLSLHLAMFLALIWPNVLLTALPVYNNL